MLKALRLLATLILCVPMWAQISTPKALINQKGTLANIPATCQPGQLYFASDQTPGKNTYGCTTGNVWTLQGNATAGTVTSIATDCGLTGGPITSSGTLSATGPCYATGGGTAQAQTATFSPAATLTDGFEVCWKPAAANTAAAPTFAPNGLTAHTIVKAGGALVANDIVTTAQACAIYNTTGTRWELQNPQTGAAISNNGTITAGTGIAVSGAGCTPPATGNCQITALGFPLSANKGSLVGVGINAALTTTSWFPGTNNTSGCGATIVGSGSWLVGGTFRNLTAFTTSTNGASAIGIGVNPGCVYSSATGTTTVTTGALSGGPIIGPLAGAGAFTSTSNYANFWHQNAFTPFAFGAVRYGTFTGSTVLDIAAEFVDDSGLYHTIIPNGSTTALTASTTQYLGFYGTAVNNTELNVAIPIPIAGTIDGSMLCDSAGSSVGAAVTLRKNSAAGGSNGFTQGANTGCNWDVTNTVAVVAGDYVDMRVVSGGATAITPISSQISFYPSVGTSTIVGGYLGATTVSTTKTFNAPLTSKTSTTEASAQTVLPVAMTCTNLYVVKATANSAVTTTYTIRDNGVDTAITGTESSGTGAIAIYTGTGVALPAGDKISLSYVTASGTSGVMAGWSMSCQ